MNFPHVIGTEQFEQSGKNTAWFQLQQNQLLTTSKLTKDGRRNENFIG